MSGGYNTNPGSLQVSKGEVIWMRTYVLRSSSVNPITYGFQDTYVPPETDSSSPPFPSVCQGNMLETMNLPNLQWYVWLDTIYTTDTGVGNVTFFPQNNITFVPLASESAIWAGPTAPGGNIGLSAYPMAAPIVLPIGVPVRINITAPVNSIGVWFQLPITPNVPPAAAQFGTYNRVHVMLSASA